MIWSTANETGSEVLDKLKICCVNGHPIQLFSLKKEVLVAITIPIFFFQCLTEVE